MRILFGLVGLVAVTACSSTLPRYPAKAPAVESGFYTDRSRADLAMIEYRVAKYLDWDDRPTDRICVASKQHLSAGTMVFTSFSEPVESAFYRRFPALEPLENCAVAADAAIFTVEVLECEQRSECSADVGYRIGPRGYFNRYVATWKNGEWQLRYEPQPIVLTGQDG